MQKLSKKTKPAPIRRPAKLQILRALANMTFAGILRVLAGFYEISCAFRRFRHEVEWLRERPPEIRRR